MFRMMTQNSREFYYNGNESGKDLDTTKMKFEQKMEYVQNMQAGEFAILKDAVIHIFDAATLNPLAEKLCNLMEAQVTDMIVPFYTKYIVVDKITPVYKQTLSTLQSRAFEAERTPNKSNIQGMLNIQTVSMEWLRECFMQERILSSELYRP